MLNGLIRFSLQHQLLVMAVTLLLVGYGWYAVTERPIDVFPDLNRPRVVIMTEAPGMAPEEVETLITFPIETAVNGANGVAAVRSSSGIGISIVYVEFDWATDLQTDRLVVLERLQLLEGKLPPGVRPTLAPVSSIMGQILVLAMYSEQDQTDPLELRSLADWTVRQRLLTVPGVSQIFTMGGERQQFQVLVDPVGLRRYGISLAEVREAVAASNANSTGGYLDQQGPNELLVRALGRIQSIEELRKVVVATRSGQPVALAQVADVRAAGQVKRGDGSAYVRVGATFSGGPAAVLTINKQPGSDTRQVTQEILAAVAALRPGLPEDVRIVPVYEQRAFIDRAMANVGEALRDGGLLVVVVLFVFLLNVRTTLITLTAIPLSLLLTAIVFSLTGMSINTMTLGGLAVAMGELVDDAIVDVENIFRRLRENLAAGRPVHPLRVVYQASLEIRSSIVFGTLIVILAFVPLFALSGMEGRLFSPLGFAYIVSILASLLVSLTVTPILGYWLLGKSKLRGAERDGFVLGWLKWVGGGVIQFSLRFPRWNLGITLAAVALAGLFVSQLEQDFLPPFNEGTIQLNVVLPPGTSLATSNQINRTVEARLREVSDLMALVRRTGRAELDEHAEGVNMSEYLLELDPHSGRSRAEKLAEIRQAISEIPGIVTAVEQPLAHLISHMLSGVKAQIGIKIFGDDLDVLRRTAEQLSGVIKKVPGVTDLLIEPQVLIPQIRIEADRDLLLQYGLRVEDVNGLISTAMNGDVVSTVLIGQRQYDLLVRLNEATREDIAELRRLPLDLPDGSQVPLEAVASIYESAGPNTINREQVQRRIVLQCNVTGRGVVDVVEEIRAAVAGRAAALPAGYFVEYGGQFESQQSASRMIGLLFAGSVAAMFLVLYSLFGSVNLAVQVLAALPMAFIGAVAALVVTGQTLTIASMVGFISLAGIASRNGILLLSHYLHLVRYEGEDWTREMIVRAGQERLAPVLMTALTSGIALVPLVLSADEPGKEILYPVATVILGGLISSTLLDFFVHPALFWLFGLNAARQVVAGGGGDALDVFEDSTACDENMAETGHTPAPAEELKTL